MKSKRRIKKPSKALQILRNPQNNKFRTIIRGESILGYGAQTLNTISTSGPSELAFLLHYPTYFRNLAGTVGQMVTVSSGWGTSTTGLISVFDMYKVNSLTVNYVPGFVNHQGNSSFNMILSEQCCYFTKDADDTANLTTEAKAMNQVSNHKFDLAKKHTIKMYPNSTMKHTWFNCSVNATTGVGTQTSIQPANSLGGIKVLVAQYSVDPSTANAVVVLPSATFCQFDCEWDVTFKGMSTLI